jgi:hypothetical protein
VAETPAVYSCLFSPLQNLAHLASGHDLAELAGRQLFNFMLNFKFIVWRQPTGQISAQCRSTTLTKGTHWGLKMLFDLQHLREAPAEAPPLVSE